jgi:hypothetical protein
MRSTQWQLGTLEPSQHLLQERGKPRKPVSRWPVAGPSGFLVNNIYNFSSYLTGNKLRLRYRDQAVNFV